MKWSASAFRAQQAVVGFSKSLTNQNVMRAGFWWRSMEETQKRGVHRADWSCVGQRRRGPRLLSLIQQNNHRGSLCGGLG